MFRYAHSTQTGQSRLVSILQNIRRTNIDRLVAISYQIPVVDSTSRTKVGREDRYFAKKKEVSNTPKVPPTIVTARAGGVRWAIVVAS